MIQMLMIKNTKFKRIAYSFVIAFVFLSATFNVGISLYFKHRLHNDTHHPHYHYY